MAGALTDMSGSAVCVRSQEALHHPCILATLSERWLVLSTQLFLERIHDGMVTQKPAAIAESRPTHPPVRRRCCCSVVSLGHRGRGWVWGGGV